MKSLKTCGAEKDNPLGVGLFVSGMGIQKPSGALEVDALLDLTS